MCEVVSGDLPNFAARCLPGLPKIEQGADFCSLPKFACDDLVQRYLTRAIIYDRKRHCRPG